MFVAALFPTFPRYEGSLGPFLLFNASFLALILLVFPRPSAYAYTFLALFLFLGFWMKFVVHTIFGYPFVEPVGNFDGAGAAWDRALLVASFAALGVGLARSAHLLHAKWFSSGSSADTTSSSVPGWYADRRKIVWVGTISLILLLNGSNFFLGFYQVGLGPKVILPLYLNVVAAWLINIGFALWVSALVYWETIDRPSNFARALLLPILEGLVSTVSMLSRKAYVFHTIPYLFVLLKERLRLRRALTVRSGGVLASLFLLGFAVSLVLVSVLRLYAYPTPTVDPDGTGPETETLATADPVIRNQLIMGMATQVLGLSVDRWTGLEGVLSVTSHPNLGPETFLEVLTEDPNVGEGAVYQQVSGANALYEDSDETTFMTLPGSVAVLYFSGSLLAVLAGMSLLTSFVILVEVAASRFVANPFLTSVVGIATTTTIVELNFPYLAAVFCMQLFVGLSFIYLVQNVHLPLRRRASQKGT